MPVQQTSHDAYKASKPNSAVMEARILVHLEARGVEGATDEEMDITFGTEQTRSNRPSRLALVKRGFVRDSGLRRPTRSNRKAIVWMWVPLEEREAQASAAARDALAAKIRRRVAKLSLAKLKLLQESLTALEAEPEPEVEPEPKAGPEPEPALEGVEPEPDTLVDWFETFLDQAP
jgi:hypothetical protein